MLVQCWWEFKVSLLFIGATLPHLLFDIKIFVTFHDVVYQQQECIWKIKLIWDFFKSICIAGEYSEYNIKNLWSLQIVLN